MQLIDTAHEDPKWEDRFPLHWSWLLACIIRISVNKFLIELLYAHDSINYHATSMLLQYFWSGTQV